MQSSDLYDEFTIEEHGAVRLTDLHNALHKAQLDNEPHYVHFCGHGEENGIALENENGETKLVPPEQLANIFKQYKDNLNCVLLNACYSEEHAKTIAEFIPYAVGMKQSISNETAIEFAQFFYRKLFERTTSSINEAFDGACNAIYRERNIPKLIQKIALSAEKERWQKKIQDRISELQKDKNLSRFLSFLEILENKLRQVSNRPDFRKHYKILEGFIEIFKQIQQGKSPDNARDKVTQQDKWSVLGDVFQPQGKLYEFYLYGDIPDFLKSELIPIVLVVMDANKAKELESQIINNTSNTNKTYYEALKTLLVNDWTQRYKTSSESWQPFSAGKDAITIKELMGKALNCVENCNRPLKPEFIDICSLNNTKNRDKLNSLRKNGCIIIMDIISVEHQNIQRELMQSGLIYHKNTLIASIFPLSKELEIIQHTILTVEQHINKEFHHRFTLDLDNQCARLSGNIETNRWIKEQMPKLLPDHLKTQDKGQQGFPWNS